MIAHKDPRLPAAAAVPEGPDWVALLHAIAPETAETLVCVTRTLYPHDRFPDRVYRRVVLAFDQLAQKTQRSSALVAELVAALDAGFPVPFRARSEGYRVAALRALEGTPAFRYVQRGTVRYLYDDVEVWAALGYEGASFHLGGYIERGFDDLDWLPPVPEHR